MAKEQLPIKYDSTTGELARMKRTEHIYDWAYVEETRNLLRRLIKAINDSEMIILDEELRDEIENIL